MKSYYDHHDHRSWADYPDCLYSYQYSNHHDNADHHNYPNEYSGELMKLHLPVTLFRPDNRNLFCAQILERSSHFDHRHDHQHPNSDGDRHDDGVRDSISDGVHYTYHLGRKY